MKAAVTRARRWALAAIAAFAASTGNAWAADNTLSDSSPEPLLAEVLNKLESNHLDEALQLTESLLRRYPNFRLGHLIKGDLLLARSRPISGFGEGAKRAAGEEKVADLRQEAIARLKAYRERPKTDAVPRYLLQMQADQKYAIVVDTEKARLYVYRNDAGTPRFVADYYVTHGKLGTDKVREGDKKTPVGVYHVTASLPRSKLTDFYGSGAFPISYPNEWDRRHGRNGHGIWLHGTPSDTFSRPPKASDGCVVLANKDLDALAKNLQIGVTPVIISSSIEWLSLDDWHAERASLQKAMEEWRADWESLNTERYLSHYSKKFSAEGQNFEQWAARKRQVGQGKSWVKVAAKDVSMFRNPGKEEYVLTTFEQEYKSNNLSNVMKKRQFWIKEDGRWKIVYESAV